MLTKHLEDEEEEKKESGGEMKERVPIDGSEEKPKSGPTSPNVANTANIEEITETPPIKMTTSG